VEGKPGAFGRFKRPAECNSAIQQIANLRYEEAFAAPLRFSPVILGMTPGMRYSDRLSI
jgi:hypothetical protein